MHSNGQSNGNAGGTRHRSSLERVAIFLDFHNLFPAMRDCGGRLNLIRLRDYLCAGRHLSTPSSTSAPGRTASRPTSRSIISSACRIFLFARRSHGSRRTGASNAISMSIWRWMLLNLPGTCIPTSLFLEPVIEIFALWRSGCD